MTIKDAHLNSRCVNLVETNPFDGRDMAAPFDRDPTRTRQGFDCSPRAPDALLRRKSLGQVTGDKINARVKLHARHMPTARLTVGKRLSAEIFARGA